jgi:2-phosphosulfolactate phosphatase
LSGQTPGHGQEGYRCRHEWGRAGARLGAERGDIVVIVDTLRFSTAAAAAIDRGAWIYPCATEEEAIELRERIGGEIAAAGRFSLSPSSYKEAKAYQRIILPSPNGATCVGIGRDAPYLFVGAPVCASAVAAAVTRLMDDLGLAVTVVSCGERQGDDGEGLRPAIEDYLGAGAILSRLPGERSPEAALCAAAFEAETGRLGDLLWECESGRELRAKGLGEDVRFAADLDRFQCVPQLFGTELVRSLLTTTIDDLRRVAALMETFPHRWWVAGGWALDLLAGEPYRWHEDLEIGIDRRHQLALQQHLAGRQLFKAAPTVKGKPWDHVPWEPGERLALPIFQVLARDPAGGPEELEFFLNEVEDGEWCFRRDLSVRRSLDAAIMRGPGGIPILAPEVQLLHKARLLRPKDRRDFERVLPLMTEEQRAWLRAALSSQFPGHAWLDRLP